MNLLDRFLSNMTVEHNIDNYTGGSQYELASLTSLCIEIKINTNQHHLVHIERSEKLSRCKFTKHDMSGMELVIIITLKWNVFTPFPDEYVSNYLSVLASQGSAKLCEKIMDISIGNSNDDSCAGVISEDNDVIVHKNPHNYSISGNSANVSNNVISFKPIKITQGKCA